MGRPVGWACRKSTTGTPPFLAGLIDVERLDERQYDADPSSVQQEGLAPIRPSFGVDSGAIRGSAPAQNASIDADLGESAEGDRAQPHHRGVSDSQRTDAPAAPGDSP